MLNVAMVNANLRILRRRISANFSAIQVEFCVCRIPIKYTRNFRINQPNNRVQTEMPLISHTFQNLSAINRTSIELCYTV